MRDLLAKIAGEWRGKNLLRLSWVLPPEHYSESHLVASGLADGKFATLSYSWMHDRMPQEGFFLLAMDEKGGVATGAWVDSWHQSARVMQCKGTLSAEGVLELRGSYEAPPGPDWGWRIVVSSPSADALHLSMYNCSPDGAEELAVQVEYGRPDR
jgi:hypothetical protein